MLVSLSSFLLIWFSDSFGVNVSFFKKIIKWTLGLILHTQWFDRPWTHCTEVRENSTFIQDPALSAVLARNKDLLKEAGMSVVVVVSRGERWTIVLSES